MNLQEIISQRAADGTELVLARNDFLDTFTDLEVMVSRVLRSCGHAPRAEPFCQRIKAFRTAEKTTMIAKCNLGQRDQIADEMIALLPVRADIVHSRMTVATIDGRIAAIFVNAQEAGTEYPSARILTLPQFKALVRKTAKLTERICGLGRVNPASSPPPPSPGAAAVP